MMPKLLLSHVLPNCQEVLFMNPKYSLIKSHFLCSLGEKMEKNHLLLYERSHLWFQWLVILQPILSDYTQSKKKQVCGINTVMYLLLDLNLYSEDYLYFMPATFCKLYMGIQGLDHLGQGRTGFCCKGWRGKYYLGFVDHTVHCLL